MKLAPILSLLLVALSGCVTAPTPPGHATVTLGEEPVLDEVRR
jgi:hypothetical protein